MSFLLGLAGRAIHDEGRKGATGKKYRDLEPRLGADVPSICRNILTLKMAAIQENKDWLLEGGPAHRTLELYPFVVFNLEDSGKARLWTVLKVELWNREWNSREWWTRYIVTLDVPRPMTGEDGWASPDGRALKTALHKSMDKAVGIFLEDLSLSIRDLNVAQEKMNGHWLYCWEAKELNVKVLRQEENNLVLALLADGTEPFSGITIVPKDFPEVRVKRTRNKGTQDPDPTSK